MNNPENAAVVFINQNNRFRRLPLATPVVLANAMGQITERVSIGCNGQQYRTFLG